MPDQPSDSPNPILEASKKVREFVRTLIPADDERLTGDFGYQTVETIVRNTLSIAWAESVRDAWKAIVDGNPNLKALDAAARTMMAEHQYDGDPICMPPGQEAFICTVGDKKAVCLDYSMAYAIPLSSIYADKVREAMDKAEAVMSKMPPKITNVYSFPNGMTMVFDQFGHQMPEYQGKTEEVMPKIKATGFAGEPTRATWP
jgi:hypothetical protein